MKRGNKILVLTISSALLAAGALLCVERLLPVPGSVVRGEGFTPEEQAQLERLGTLTNMIRIGHIPDSPPIDFIDGGTGRRKGLTWDYVERVEQKLGLRFERVECGNWEEDLRTNKVDLVGSIQNTPERRRMFRFTRPYRKIEMVILARKDGNGALSLDGMEGKRVGVVKESALYRHLRQLRKNDPERYGYVLVPVENTPEGLRKTSEGTLDALVADGAVSGYYLAKLDLDLRVAGEIDYAWELSFASHTNSALPNAILNKALAQITAVEENSIARQWPTLHRGEVNGELLLRISGGVLIATLLGIGGVVFWNRTLRRQLSLHLSELGRVRQSHAQATRALGESEERFRVLVESSNDIIWEMDRYGSYTYVSPHVRDVLGYTPEELQGKSSVSLMVPADSARKMEQLRNRKAGSMIECEVNTYVHRSGHHVILESSGMAFANNTGELAGFRGVSRDITERIAGENALRRSEERFRNLVETTSDWIWEVDVEGRYTYASPQSAGLLGLSPDELIGKHFTEPMPEAEVEPMRSLFAEMLAEGQSIHSMVNTNRHREGHHVVLETSAVPFHDKEWTIQGYRGISRDITERVAAERQLAFERNLFRTFMEHAPDLICFKDAEGRFIEVNTAMAEELRLPPEKIVGRTDFDFLPEEQARKKFDDELAVMRTRTPIQKEELVTTPAGNRWYLTTKVPRYDEKGKVAGTFGTSWNITYRKETEEQLRQLRALLSNTIDSMPSVLVGVDAEGRVIQWNRRAETNTGLSSKNALGLHLRNAYPELAREMVKVERAIREGQTQHEERVQSRKSGRIRYHDTTVFPLVGGETEGAVIRVDDVTDRVRIEEMMVQSEKMMSVGGLAAGMAHEINNPLAGILQNLQVIRNRIMHRTDRNASAARKAGTTLEAIQGYMEARDLIKMLDTTSEAGRRAAKIVDNMLSFSRKEESNFMPNNLAEIIERSLELASNDYNLKKRFDFRHIRIDRDFAELPPISCEAGQIQQVLLNLLSNSAQAMAEHPSDVAEPRITVRLKRERDMALIEVEDNGPGMDAETRKRVFEPFFTTKEVGCGTGLGLSVSYFIVTENHGGAMSMVSEPGKGACFSIRIPFEHRLARWGLRL